MYNVIPMDEELKQALKGAMGVDELSVEELTGYSIKTHQGTGIQYVVKEGAEGRGGMPLLRTQRDIEKYNDASNIFRKIVFTYFQNFTLFIFKFFNTFYSN